MLVIPSIDLEKGRSRIVSWPGAAAGVGAPTDRPEVIAERFAAAGARLIHLVDFDGARTGAPVNLEAVGRIAGRVAIPLQLAGGLEGADQVRLAFAAGATRVVLALSVADQPQIVRECVAVAGDWLAVGLDPRPERLAAFPWRGGAGGETGAVPTLESLIGRLTDLGVRRFVLSHGGARPDPALLSTIVRTFDADVLVAGGATSLDDIRSLRESGIQGLILGEPLLTGSIDYPAALEAAA